MRTRKERGAIQLQPYAMYIDPSNKGRASTNRSPLASPSCELANKASARAASGWAENALARPTLQYNVLEYCRSAARFVLFDDVDFCGLCRTVAGAAATRERQHSRHACRRSMEQPSRSEPSASAPKKMVGWQKGHPGRWAAAPGKGGGREKAGVSGMME